MKKSICLLILLVITLGNVKGQSTTDKMKNLMWLEGTWSRLNNKTGQSGFERWTKSSSIELRGVGVTLKGTDTLFVEKLRILERDGDLYYVADVPENQKPVHFKLTNITSTEFVCENPAHDFPKKITYRRDKEKLTATISGDGKSVAFLFQKE